MDSTIPLRNLTYFFLQPELEIPPPPCLTTIKVLSTFKIPTQAATFSMKIYQIPQARKHISLITSLHLYLFHRIHQRSVITACLSSTELQRQNTGSQLQQKKFGPASPPGHLPRTRQLPLLSSLPLMQARRTPSPFPSLRTFTTFITFCKTSLLKPGYGVEISLSNPSFLAAHKDQTISPLFSKIFFLITMDFSISGNKNFKCMIVIKMKMFLWFWLGSLALIPF